MHSYIAMWALLLVVGVFGFILGMMTEKSSRWKLFPAQMPRKTGRTITNYPVAFFDEEFGIIVDQAEFHPNRAQQWLTVPDGDPCKPFAWYDLPNPPHPMDTIPSDDRRVK